LTGAWRWAVTWSRTGAWPRISTWRGWASRALPARSGLALLALGAGALVWSAWIPAKAALGQVLLERAWERTVAGAPKARPWPWADTRPVARLIVPRLEERLLVLEGAGGATLAWGPGHLPGTPLPGAAAGNAVVAGHRDTHFAFLERLTPGDLLEVETVDGRTTSGSTDGWPGSGPRSTRGLRTAAYRVTAIRVVDEGDTRWLGATDEPALTLVTCYPFDAVVPGGPLRFVVRAVRVDARPADRRAALPATGSPGHERWGRWARSAHLVPNIRSPASPSPGTM